MTGVTKEEMAAIYEIGNALCAPTLTVRCSRCQRDIGTTTDPKRTVDLCTLCHTQWVAEMKREKNLLAKTMPMLQEAMAKPQIRRVK